MNRYPVFGSIVFFLAMLTLPSGRVHAQLPGYDDIPWVGFFSGYERRNFHFGVNIEGQSELYILDSGKKDRVKKKTIKISAHVLEQDSNGKLTVKQLKKDAGFVTEMKPGLDHEKVSFTAESTGDAKVEVTIKYDRDKIILDGKIIDPGTLKGENVYFAFKVSVPDMYEFKSGDYDDKALKKKLRKDKIKFLRADNSKRISLKSYEDVDLSSEKMAKDGVTSIEVAMECQEDLDFIYTTENGIGVIEFENKKPGEGRPLYKGYTVTWKRLYVKEDEAGDGKKNAAIRSSASKKEISPFVIEIK